MPIVLVVEDDPFINLNVAETIERAGLQALTAFKVDEALAALAGRDDIAVLITDVHMRGERDGRCLAFEAQRLHPSIGLIVATGLSRSEVGELPAGTVYLGKPFTEAEVQAAVRGAMA